MAGPNPYPVHSFLELRKIMGRAYVVCRPCRRFVPIGAWLDRRDTRTTSFSCSVCGGDGTLVLEDPAQDGLQHDPRPNPSRHRLAALRLQAFHRLGDPFCHRAAAREAPPRRDKPYFESLPRFRLVPLPIRTFRQALDFGLALGIHCPRCHDTRPVELGAEQLERPFALTRFVCRCWRLKAYGEGREVCGERGEVVFKPVASPEVARTVVDIQCVGARRRRHSGWEIRGADLAAPPWAGLLDTRGERFACPGCGGGARHTFHVPYRTWSAASTFQDRRSPGTP